MSAAKWLRSRFLAALAAAVLAAQVAPAQTFTVLHDFTGGSDGYGPGDLTLVGTSNLFGGAGTTAVFRLRKTGSSWLFNPIFEFNGTDGLGLAGLTAGPGGALYGAAGSGGLPECFDGSGCGLIFSMRPPSSICNAFSCPWTESVLYQFDPYGHPDDGYGPGRVTFDGSGNVLGTTGFGGVFDGGTIFELTHGQGGWTESILHSFGQQGDGIVPLGFILDRAGNIIGTTQFGGNNGCLGSGCGVVYQLTHTGSGWSETILHAFSYATDGGQPGGGLISDAAGNLYGVATYGGPNNGGTVYELTPSGGGYTFQVVYAFPGNPGPGPVDLPAMDSSGNLYGSNESDGTYSRGSIYKLTHTGGSWVYSDLHDFNGIEGNLPLSGPTLDPSGNLYGTTLYGGTGSCSGGCGVLWQIAP
jgi:uncharacterized repeat protein (TIGR03803 family)